MQNPIRQALAPRPFRIGLLVLICAIPPLTQAGSWEIGYSFDAPSSLTNGLTYDGRLLWHTNDREPIIYQIDPNSGRVVNQFETKVADQGDLEWAGGFLYVVDEYKHLVHQIDSRTGKELDTIPVLGMPIGASSRRGRDSVQVEALTFDGRDIWVDGDTNKIVRIDMKTHKQYMYEMPYDMGYLDGMAWAFDHLWIVTNNAVIFEIDPCSMRILDRFDAPANAGAGPEGFAFDGENLWFADNQLDKIYKIILKDKLLTKRAVTSQTQSTSAACNGGTLVTTQPRLFNQVPQNPVTLSPLPSVESENQGNLEVNPAVLAHKQKIWVKAWRPGRDANSRGDLYRDTQGRSLASPTP